MKAGRFAELKSDRREMRYSQQRFRRSQQSEIFQAMGGRPGKMEGSRRKEERGGRVCAVKGGGNVQLEKCRSRLRSSSSGMGQRWPVVCHMPRPDAKAFLRHTGRCVVVAVDDGEDFCKRLPLEVRGC